MAILTEGAGSSQMGSATTPMQAAQSVNPLDSLAELGGGALSVFNTSLRVDAESARQQHILDKDAKAEAGEMEDTALINSLMKVNSRFEQTGDRRDAIRLARRVLNSSLTSPGNVARGDELISTYTKYMAAHGLGKEFFEESQEEKVMAARVTAALKDGVVIEAYDSDEVKMRKLDNHAKFVQAGVALERSTAEINKANALLTQEGKLTSNESSKIQLDKLKAEEEMSTNLSKTADTFSVILQDRLASIRTRRDSGLSQQEAEMQIVQAFAEVRGLINREAGTGNESQVNALVTPLINIYEANLRYVKGLATLEELDTVRKTEDARTAAMFFARDPEAQKRIALSALIQHSDLGLTQQIGAAAIKYIDDSIQDKSTVLTDLEPAKQKAIVGVAINFMKKDTAGKATEEEKAEGLKYITKMFTDLDKYAAAVDNPKQLNEIVTMLADPVFGEWVKVNKGVPVSISVGVKDVLKAYYSEPVLKDVVQNWEKGASIDQRQLRLEGINSPISDNKFNSPSTSVAPMSEILEPHMTTSGLSFRGKAGVASTLVTPALQQAKTGITPKINKLIKAMAHIEGHTDYDIVFEDNYAKVFGVSEEDVEPTPKDPKPKMASEKFEPKEGDTIEVGDVVGDYEYLGGDTLSSSSWKKLDE